MSPIARLHTPPGGRLGRRRPRPEFLNAVVIRIGDVDVPLRVGGDAKWESELPLARAHLAEREDKLAAVCKCLNAAIGHVHRKYVSRGIDAEPGCVGKLPGT